MLVRIELRALRMPGKYSTTELPSQLFLPFIGALTTVRMFRDWRDGSVGSAALVRRREFKSPTPM